MTSPTENHNPKTKKKFLIETCGLPESVEGSNSSQAQSAGELWCCNVLQKKVVPAGLTVNSPGKCGYYRRETTWD